MSDAEQLIKEAQKALKTSLFKRTPDYDDAGRCYEQAATALQHQRQFQRAADTFIEASSCYGKGDVWFMAGKTMENAAVIYTKHMGSSKGAVLKAADLYKEAAQSYMMNNSWDRAIDSLSKAAKLAEGVGELQVACAYYGRAVECIEQEDENRLKISGEVYQKYTLTLLKAGLVDESVTAMRHFSAALAKARSFSLWYLRNGVALIVVLLSKGDEVAANKAFEQLTIESDGAWMRSDESKLMHDLLDGFEKRDQKLVTEVTSRQMITFLDRDVARMAKALVVLGGETLPAGQIDQAYVPQHSTSLVDDLPVGAFGASAEPAAFRPPEETSDLC